MTEQRKTEIAVGTAVAEWGEELVTQWNALGETIARSVQERSRIEEEHGEQERLAHQRELDRMRSALAESDARATAITRESAVRLDATRREYETKVALLQQQLEQLGQTVENLPFAEATASEMPSSDRTVYAVESGWEPEPAESRWRSGWTDLRSALTEQWTRARSGPYLIPVIGFLGGLAVMVALYPILQRPSTGLAKERVNAKPTVNASRTGEAAQGVTITPAAASAGAPAAAEEETANSDLAANSTPDGKESGGYAVLLAGGKLLTPDKPGAPSAAYEARLALRAGYDSISVYQRNDRYMAAVLFRSREEAERGLKSINADFDSRWKRTSSIVPVSEWCRVKGALEPVVINGVQVAVWSCNKKPS